MGQHSFIGNEYCSSDGGSHLKNSHTSLPPCMHTFKFRSNTLILYMNAVGAFWNFSMREKVDSCELLLHIFIAPFYWLTSTAHGCVNCTLLYSCNRSVASNLKLRKPDERRITIKKELLSTNNSMLFQSVIMTALAVRSHIVTALNFRTVESKISTYEKV